MSRQDIGSIVMTYPTRDGEGACDVRVYVDDDGGDGAWAWHTEDDAGGSDDGDDAEYPTAEEATAAAREWMDSHEEAPGQTADQYLASRRDEALEAAQDDSSPDGEWACYWSTALGDSGPRSRYRTREAAEAVADASQRDLEAAHPGSLLCGFEVRQLVDGAWVLPEI